MLLATAKAMSMSHRKFNLIWKYLKFQQGTCRGEHPLSVGGKNQRIPGGETPELRNR